MVPELIPVRRHAAIIDIYSHNVCLHGYGRNVKELLVEFCRRQAHMGLVRVGPGRYEKKMLRIYASTTRTRNEFRFHRNQLDQLLAYLSSRGVRKEELCLNEVPLYEPEKVELELRDTRPPREKQVPIIAYLEEPPLAGYAPSKVVTLQPGGGKSYIAVKAMKFYGYRTVIIIKPKYIQKWIGDIKQAFKLKDSDLLVVKGGEQLQALISLALEDKLTAKIIIISNATFANYLDAYQEQMMPNGGYPVPPSEFYQTIKAGIRLIDEVHQDFHRNFRFDLYGHIPLTISMSGTLDSDNRFINERYFIVWPDPTRPPEQEFDAYVEVNSIMYSIKQPEKIRCLGFAKMYSHIKFEESILRNKQMRDSYVDMIVDIVDKVYIVDRQPGQKMFVFCATITMCTIVSNALQQAYSHVSVERYVGDDDYESNCLQPDIVVSTLQSAGTAVDVPNMRETLMTNALDSKQANIQVLSRTRKLVDWPDVTPRFWFLVAREIPKHVEYARSKEEKFRGKVKSMRSLQSDYRI